MASNSIKNIAMAIYESSRDKTGSDLDSAILKSATWIKDKNLIGKKEEILKSLESIINKENSIVKAKVKSGKKLDESSQREIEDFIKKKYKAKEVILELKEDKNLLGGIKLEVGNDIIDTTLSNKIHQLKTYLITN